MTEREQIHDLKKHLALMTKINEHLLAAFKEMRAHLCSSQGKDTCSQMWYQEVMDEALEKCDLTLEGTPE